MYNDYFKLSCLPFENTLEQRFIFKSECHKEVIAALLYFAGERKSFAMVCGDVGTGKTMIVHNFLGRLPACVQPIVIPYPDVGYLEILGYIARSLRISTQGKGTLELSDAIKAELTKADGKGGQVLLIIDEAHLLPVASLENIRLLSNIELTERKLLQILLIGQNELAQKLQKPELRQLRQRININRVLSPMTPAETIDYIDNRLKIAGASYATCFEPDCRKPLYQMTGGVPRSINGLCDTALLICMTQKDTKVTERILKKARGALKSDSIVLLEAPPATPLFPFKKRWPALAAALVLLLAVSFIGYSLYFGRRLNTSVHDPVAQKDTGGPPIVRPVPASEEKAHEVPASKAGVNSSPATIPSPIEKPAPVPAQVSTSPPPEKVQATDDRDKNAMAGKKVSLPGTEAIPAPLAAKSSVALRSMRDESPQMVVPVDAPTGLRFIQ